MDPPVRLPRLCDHGTDGWRVEAFDMASHSGTHLDAPLHRFPDGASIDRLPLERFTGRPLIADLTSIVHADQAIGATLLEQALAEEKLDDTAVVLLNTGWGHRRSATDEWLYHSPYLSAEGAAWLVERNVRGVGIDHFSIGGIQPETNARTHEVLLSAKVWVVEDLCFRDGWRDAVNGAFFQALPLYLPGFSGSPCRAVLMQVDGQ